MESFQRLEILSRYGEKQTIINNLEDYFTYMAEKTGTLWENKGDYASCNHGFASHVIRCIFRDGLGIMKVNIKDKLIEIDIGHAVINVCEAVIPVEDLTLYLKYCVEDGMTKYKIKEPEGYTLKYIK